MQRFQTEDELRLNMKFVVTRGVTEEIRDYLWCDYDASTYSLLRPRQLVSREKICLMNMSSLFGGDSRLTMKARI
jgi:hypothetical protein